MIRRRPRSVPQTREETPMGSDCLFCKIVSGEVPAAVVRRTERSVAFRDINPQAPTHVLVVSRAHHPDVAALAAADPDALADLVGTAAAVAADEGVDRTGYRLVFNSGRGAGQAVFHVHGHLLGGRAMSWPPG
jgi:histidine triad (HIT) family protein